MFTPAIFAVIFDPLTDTLPYIPTVTSSLFFMSDLTASTSASAPVALA